MEIKDDTVYRIESAIGYQYWCKQCCHATRVLYMFEDKRYCEDCVPKELKEKAIHINQNRELIEG